MSVRGFAGLVASVLLAVLAAASAAAAQEPVRADTVAQRRAQRPDSLARPAQARSDSTEAVPSVPRDSIMKRLLELDGYRVTEYQGAGARFDVGSGRVVLIGKAKMSRAGRTMTADSVLIYNRRTDVACGYGDPVLSGRGSPIHSEQICYDVERRVGVAQGAETKFSQGTTWFVHGERAVVAGSEKIYAEDTRFTSCSLDHPHYHFSAEAVKIVEDQVLVARDVTLNFKDVPVFWLPWMVKSMKQGRRSGLLMPQFGLTDIVRTDSDYDRHISNIGFYWAINEYMGAKVAFDWFSDHWLALDGAFDYRWREQFLRGGIQFSRYWRENGSTDLTLQSYNSWQPGENTNVSVDVNYTSSSEFVRRNSYNPERLRRQIRSSASIDHQFGWGGSLSLGAERSQSLLREEVNLTFPGLFFSIPAMTFFEAPRDEASWYNNLTWSGTSLSFDSRRTIVPDSLADARDRSRMTASVSTGFRLGNFSVSQSANFTQNVLGARPLILDSLGDTTSVALPRELDRRVGWNVNLSYQQNLIGQTTFSPRLSLRGQFARSDSVGRMVAAPTRIDFGASLRTAVFGFWPGVGPFSQIRHAIYPSISYTYSPKPTVTPLQEQVFGLPNLRARNQIRLSISQTIEAKMEVPDSVAAARDSAAAGTNRGGEPRRLPSAPKKTLLSINTSAIAYDFVRARETGSRALGFTTPRLTNTIRSDLLPGLSVTIGHDLFRNEGGPDGTGRTFDPHLQSIRTGFTLNSDSWIIRMLGLSGDEGAAADSAAADTAGEGRRGFDSGGPPGRSGDMMMPDGPRRSRRFGGGGAGSWSLRVGYRMLRPRGRDGDQELDLRLSFDPTKNWSVNWRTSYDINANDFGRHFLTLTRNLHRWTANFSFVKAQNGNFSFRFFVRLRDNRSIKLDYEQRGQPIRAPGVED